jgi:hypothetical protein
MGYCSTDLEVDEPHCLVFERRVRSVCSSNLYLLSPDPMQERPRRLHREQAGFFSSHFNRLSISLFYLASLSHAQADLRPISVPRILRSWHLFFFLEQNNAIPSVGSRGPILLRLALSIPNMGAKMPIWAVEKG